MIELWSPIRTIIEIKIDGDVVDPTSYRVIRDRYLQRLDDVGPPVAHRVWPSCQNVTLDDSEDGTFSIVYTYGRYPPESGKLAAAQLAANLLKECNGEACALPAGTTRITRQGVQIEKASFAAWVRETGWKTGMPLVDAFLSGFNPSGLQRRPVIWSPRHSGALPAAGMSYVVNEAAMAALFQSQAVELEVERVAQEVRQGTIENRPTGPSTYLHRNPGAR